MGEGYCRDANGEFSTNWSGGENRLYDDDLSACQANCKENSSEAGSAGCVGIYFTQNPYEICILYLSLETPVVPVETSSGAAVYGTCYQYLSDTPPPMEPETNSGKVCDALLRYFDQIKLIKLNVSIANLALSLFLTYTTSTHTLYILFLFLKYPLSLSLSNKHIQH